MGYVNQKVLGITTALLVFAIMSCTSKPEGEISKSKRQPQESSMTTQEQAEQESSTTAQSQEEPSTTPEETAQAQETFEDSGVVAITGTVEHGPEGIIISADDGTYAVSGSDLSDMIGRTVQITGALKESEGVLTIEIDEMVVVK